MRYGFLVASLAVFLLLDVAGAATVGFAKISAPAVIVSNNTGAMTAINLTVTNGSGNVVVVGPEVIGITTVQSAYTAAQYATAYLNLSFNNYNFTYAISDASENVSGPSAGGAMTLLAISALSHKQLRPNFTMTGTISSDGSLGEVGGVYDKVGAAADAGVKLMLVPSTPAGSQEDVIYLLAQTDFGIPLVQVSNINGAAYYAFNKSISGTANETRYNFYTNYSVNKLPNATLACSNGCNMSVFGQLVNTTLNYTGMQIMNLSANTKLGGIAAQLMAVLNESAVIEQHKYLYAGANLAFLDYINAFYFSNSGANVSSGLQTLLSTQQYCSSLVQPALTSRNYEYVLGAELRYSWANYTINNTIAEYNVSSIDTDDVLSSIYSAAQADGWCRASGTIYALQQANGTSGLVQPSNALAAVALSRINRSQVYGPSIYLNTAQIAYKQGNYPIAILDADYAYVLYGSSASIGSMANNEIIGAAESMLTANATYGVWATEFAKESLFYINESNLASNSTLAHTYAIQAYSSAALAQHIGSDTLLIYRNLLPVSLTTQNVNLNNVLVRIGTLNNMILILLVLLTLVVLLIAINVVLLAMLLKRQGRAQRTRHAGRGRRRRNR